MVTRKQLHQTWSELGSWVIEQIKSNASMLPEATPLPAGLPLFPFGGAVIAPTKAEEMEFVLSKAMGKLFWDNQELMGAVFQGKLEFMTASMGSSVLGGTAYKIPNIKSAGGIPVILHVPAGCPKEYLKSASVYHRWYMENWVDNHVRSVAGARLPIDVCMSKMPSGMPTKRLWLRYQKMSQKVWGEESQETLTSAAPTPKPTGSGELTYEQLKKAMHMGNYQGYYTKEQLDTLKKTLMTPPVLKLSDIQPPDNWDKVSYKVSWAEAHTGEDSPAPVEGDPFA